VDDERQVELKGQVYLLDERYLLRVARGQVAVEVQPGLADGDDALVGREPYHLRQHLLGRGLRIVRMNADGPAQARLLGDHARHLSVRGRVVPDRDDGSDPGLGCPQQHAVEVLEQARVGDMGMAIYQHGCRPCAIVLRRPEARGLPPGRAGRASALTR